MTTANPSIPTDLVRVPETATIPANTPYWIIGEGWSLADGPQYAIDNESGEAVDMDPGERNEGLTFLTRTNNPC